MSHQPPASDGEISAADRQTHRKTVSLGVLLCGILTVDECGSDALYSRLTIVAMVTIVLNTSLSNPQVISLSESSY